jgi:hypothetical protein
MRRRFSRTLLTLVLLLAGAGTALVYGPYMVWRSYAVRAWPTVEGVVTQSELVETRKSGDRAWRPEVEVRYVVDGAEHTTDAIWAAGDRSFRDQGEARTVLARYAVGGAARVSYDPDDPSDAILDPGEVWRAWLTVGFGLVLIIAGLAVVARKS